MFNKADQLEEGAAEAIATQRGGVAVSALSKDSFQSLLLHIEATLYPNGEATLGLDAAPGERTHVGVRAPRKGSANDAGDTGEHDLVDAPLDTPYWDDEDKFQRALEELGKTA